MLKQNKKLGCVFFFKKIRTHLFVVHRICCTWRTGLRQSYTVISSNLQERNNIKRHRVSKQESSPTSKIKLILVLRSKRSNYLDLINYVCCGCKGTIKLQPPYGDPIVFSRPEMTQLPRSDKIRLDQLFSFRNLRKILLCGFKMGLDRSMEGRPINGY